MTSRGPHPVTDNDDSLFASTQVEVGGTTYTITELDGGTYDECVELARTDDGVDSAALLKFMLERSLSPKLNLGELNKLPMSRRRALLQAVSDLHFPAIEPGKAASA